MLSEVMDEIKARIGKPGDARDAREGKAGQPMQKTREEIEAYRQRKMREEEAFYLGKSKAKAAKAKAAKPAAKPSPKPSPKPEADKAQAKAAKAPPKAAKAPAEAAKAPAEAGDVAGAASPLPRYRNRGILVGYLYRMIEQEAEALGNAVRMGDARVMEAVKRRLDGLFADMEKALRQ